MFRAGFDRRNKDRSHSSFVLKSDRLLGLVQARRRRRDQPDGRIGVRVGGDALQRPGA
jgi:hypothetical protein